MPIARLNRTILRLSGDGVEDWLEGLITNSLSADLTFAALLTPQGKIIADFFVWQGDALYIETAEKFGPALFKRLKMYRLRAPITIEDVSETLSLYALWDTDHKEALPDPRHDHFARMKSSDPSLATASLGDWNTARLQANLPESEWDFDTAQTFPANANMDHLSGIDFKKGCYVGQEVVSRMHRKTTIRKRMQAFQYEGTLSGQQITFNGRVVGDILSAHAPYGMAMMRFDRLHDEAAPDLCVDGTPVKLVTP